jgi:hypothetical protein
MPNTGWLPSATDASRVVEEYWDAIVRRRDDISDPARDVSTATRPELPLDLLVAMGVFRNHLRCRPSTDPPDVAA